MVRKAKQIVWHKKSGKLIPSQFSKLPSKKPTASSTLPATGDKLKDFASKLKAQIKQAAEADDKTC